MLIVFFSPVNPNRTFFQNELEEGQVRSAHSAIESLDSADSMEWAAVSGRDRGLGQQAWTALAVGTAS